MRQIAIRVPAFVPIVGGATFYLGASTSSPLRTKADLEAAQKLLAKRCEQEVAKAREELEGYRTRRSEGGRKAAETRRLRSMPAAPEPPDPPAGGAGCNRANPGGSQVKDVPCAGYKGDEYCRTKCLEFSPEKSAETWGASLDDLPPMTGTEWAELHDVAAEMSARAEAEASFAAAEGAQP